MLYRLKPGMLHDINQLLEEYRSKKFAHYNLREDYKKDSPDESMHHHEIMMNCKDVIENLRRIRNVADPAYKYRKEISHIQSQIETLKNLMQYKYRDDSFALSECRDHLGQYNIILKALNLELSRVSPSFSVDFTEQDLRTFRTFFSRQHDQRLFDLVSNGFERIKCTSPLGGGKMTPGFDRYRQGGRRSPSPILPSGSPSPSEVVFLDQASPLRPCRSPSPCLGPK